MKTNNSILRKTIYLCVILVISSLFVTQIECKKSIVRNNQRKHKLHHQHHQANATKSTNATLSQEEIIRQELLQAEAIRQQKQAQAQAAQTANSNATTNTTSTPAVQAVVSPNLQPNNVSQPNKLNNTNATVVKLVKLAPEDKGFETVQYVKTISDYAKDDIRQQNDPKNKNRNLIGRHFYVENNVTYDETPQMLRDVLNEKVIRVQNIQRNSLSYNEQKYNLWNTKRGGNYQDVAFAGQSQYSSVVTVPQVKTTNVLNNQNTQKDNQGLDTLEKELSKIDNPLKNEFYQAQAQRQVNTNVFQGEQNSTNSSNQVSQIPSAKSFVQLEQKTGIFVKQPRRILNK